MFPYGSCSTIVFMAKTVLNVEIPEDLKERLVAYAEDRGLSQAAATRILLSDALMAAGYPRKAR